MSRAATPHNAEARKRRPKAATGAQGANEQRLAALYEHAGIGISEVDAEGRLLRVNQAACTITGRSRAELLRRNIFDGAYSDGVAFDLSRFRELVAGRIDRYGLTKRYVRGDGRPIWMDVTCSAVRDARGRFQFAVRVFQDVTEIRQTAAALAEKEQRLAATYENAAIAISEVDADGRLLRVNETVCAILGYSREELLGRSVFDLTHPDDRAPDLRRFAAQRRPDGEPYTIEKRLIRKDGRVIWTSIASSSVRDAEGRFLYGIRVMQDITARKQVEEMVRESESRLRQVLTALPAAVYTTDADGRVTFFNQAAVELSGREPTLHSDEWWITWKLYDIDGTPLPHAQDPMAQALQEGKAIRGRELIAERPDGSRAVIIPYPTPLHDASGALIGAVNMLLDITERKHAEERQRALIDELNHRVKNTLATVQSLAAQSLRGSDGDAAARDAFMARLFALSRAHDQLSRAGWEWADLRAIVEDVFAPYRSDGDARVRLDGGPVRLPPQRAVVLAMVLHELVTNAAKYGALSLPGGTLAVRWRVTNGTGQRLRIEWEEAGGPPVAPPRRRGFGSRLAERAITEELKGEVQMRFEPSGLRCLFEIPLTGVQA